jgi:hypothetical protein
MKKTLKEHFREISTMLKQYRDWLRGRIDNLKTPKVALPLEVSKSVLAAIDSLSDDLSYRTEMLAERQEKRQTEIDLLNANMTVLIVAVPDMSRKTMQTRSFEARLKTMEGSFRACKTGWKALSSKNLNKSRSRTTNDDKMQRRACQ